MNYEIDYWKGELFKERELRQVTERELRAAEWRAFWNILLFHICGLVVGWAVRGLFIATLLIALLATGQASAAGRSRRGYWAPSYSTPSLVPGAPCLPPVHPFAPQGVIVYPTADQFVAVNNMLRAERGLEPMQGNARLMAEAEQHARRCRDRGCISHYHGGSVASRLASIGFDCSFCEDIMVGGSPMLSRDPFAMWKASPDHYRTITANYTHCGFGVAYDARGYGYWVGIYAR